jgi:hypothetical protein
VCDLRAQTSRELIGDIFVAREVDNLLRLDHFPRDVAERADFIGQPKLDATRA